MKKLYIILFFTFIFSCQNNSESTINHVPTLLQTPRSTSPPTSSNRPTPSQASAPAPVTTNSPTEPQANSAAPAPSDTPAPQSSQINLEDFNELTKIEDISSDESTTFNGKVFDDTGAPMDNVEVRARSLSAFFPYEVKTTTIGGTYLFNNAPAGIQIEITASKDGFTTRQRVEVLKSNKKGDPEANTYNFGSETPALNPNSLSTALSNKPEVISISPARDSSEIKTSTNFVLTFSESMDKQSVEDSFAIRAFTNNVLSVDKGSGENTLTGSQTIQSITGDLIWDKNAFDIQWRTNDTEVTFTFKDDKRLPADRESDNLPDYQILFNSNQGRLIKDKQGDSRNSNHFKLTKGNFEESVRFSIDKDEGKPQITTITAETDENNGTKGDSLEIVFSEPMIYYTQKWAIAGGLEDRKNVIGSESKAPAGHPLAMGNATEANAAKNYQISITPSGSSVPLFAGTWFQLGGTAVYDTQDPKHKTIRLVPPTIMSSSQSVVGLPTTSDSLSGTVFYTNGTSENLSFGRFKQTTLNTIAHVNPINLTTTVPDLISFFYTDGTMESGVNVPTPIANTYTAMDISMETLTTGGSQWTISETGGNIDNAPDAADILNIAIAPGTQRNGKTIAWVDLNGGIFNGIALAMVNYIIVPGATSTQSSQGVTLANLNQIFAASTVPRFTLNEITNTGTIGLWDINDIYALALEKDAIINGKNVQKILLESSGQFGTSKLNLPTTLTIYPGQSGGTLDIYNPGDSIQISISTTVTDPAGNQMDSSANNASVTAN